MSDSEDRSKPKLPSMQGLSNEQIVELFECYERLLIQALVVVGAWVEFKNHHDIEDAKIQCCNRTRALFNGCETLTKESAAAYKLTYKLKGAV